MRINGENLDVVGKSVADYLDSADYDRMRLAVELNGNIVPKAQYSDTIFKDGDSVEVVNRSLGKMYKDIYNFTTFNLYLTFGCYNVYVWR